MEIFDLVFKFGVIVLLIILNLGVGGALYMYWKLLGAFRWMELSEARRSNPAWTINPPQPDQTPQTANFPRSYIQTTKQEAEGDFVTHSDFDSYVREESKKVSDASGITDKEAMAIILEKIAQNGHGTEV